LASCFFDTPLFREWRFLGFDAQIGDRLTVDEVPLDNALKVFRSAGVVPNGIGIHDGDGALGANTETVRLAAVDHPLRPAELEFGEAFFEELPRGQTLVKGAAFGLGRSGTQKNVFLVAVEMEGSGSGLKEVGHRFVSYCFLFGAAGDWSFSR